MKEQEQDKNNYSRENSENSESSKNSILRYGDIINLDRPASKYPKMSRSDRAVQFSPFAALTNYHEVIAKTENSQIYTSQEIIDSSDI